MKSSSVSTWLIYLGWLIYVVAWFAPAVNLPEHLPGWWTFIAAFSPLIYDKANFSTFARLLWVFSAFTNALPVASPLMLARKREAHRGLALSLTAAFVINSHWLASTWVPSHTLTVGYYLWWSSFLILAIGFALYRRQAT